MYEARRAAGPALGASAARCTTMRSAFDLMPHRRRGGLARTSTPGWPPSRGARRGYRDTLLARPPRPATSSRRGRSHEVADQVRFWTGQQGSAGDFFTHLVASARRRRRARRRPATSTPRQATEATAAFGRFLDDELAAARPRGGGVRPRALRAGLAATSSAPQIDLEETYAWGWEELRADRGRDGAGSPTDRARRLGRRRGRSAGRRPRPHRSPARSSSPPGCRSSPTAPSTSWPTCTSTSPSRSAGSSAGSRRPATAASTTPGRARTSAGRAGCGGRSRTAARPSRPGARSRPSSTRACPATTCRSGRRPTAASCSTGGSG